MYDMQKIVYRHYFNITLPSGAALKLYAPTKPILLACMQISAIDKDNFNAEVINNIYALVRDIINHNTSGTVLSDNEIEKYFDLPSIVDFLTAYIKWIEDIQSEKKYKDHITHTARSQKASGKYGHTTKK